MDRPLIRPTVLVLCEADRHVGASVVRLLEDRGLEAVVVERWLDVIARAVELSPDAIVVDLALAGDLGVRLIAALRAVAPGAPIVAVSPLAGIDVASLEAGAAEVAGPDDLRPLGHFLDQLGAGRTHA